MCRSLLQFFAEWLKEDVKNIQMQPIGLTHDRAKLVLHQRGKYYGPVRIISDGFIDPGDRFFCLVSGIYKWQSHLSKFLAVELREQAVAERFGGHTGLVGEKVNNAFVHRDDCPRPDREPQGSKHWNDTSSSSMSLA